eukprot:Nitzschia sp. Nitz4//scaffold326_size20077//18339//19640//NITZ4_008714-RA/size20077-augustus-gene-0.36-mRNA-1//1//CDS//3329547936//1454//frame0
MVRYLVPTPTNCPKYTFKTRTMPTKKRKIKQEGNNDTPPPTLALEDMLPSHARKTKNGGYAHTSLSKQRIGQANAGNTPWNKGKIRSSADKAKIAAGVRARNRTLLLEKLQRLGMTEEEYEEKKRQIKYLRERIRRAKLINAKHKDAETKLRLSEAEKKLQAVLDSTTEKDPPGRVVIPPATTSTSTSIVPQNLESGESEVTRIQKATKAIAQQVFSKELIWTPYRWSKKDDGNSDNDDGTSTNDDGDNNVKDDDETSSYPPCPSGGPGGLICCSACAKQYTWYLSGTMQDMEVQRLHRTGKEVQELLGFLQDSQKALDNAYETAKRKVPPLPLLLTPATTTTTSTCATESNTAGGTEEVGATTTKESATTKKRNGETVASMQWSATSAMDIAASEAAQGAGV